MPINNQMYQPMAQTSATPAALANAAAARGANQQMSNVNVPTSTANPGTVNGNISNPFGGQSGQILQNLDPKSPVGIAGASFLGEQQQANSNEAGVAGQMAGLVGQYANQQAPQTGYVDPGAAHTAQGASAGRAQLGPASQAGYSTIDQSQANQTRNMSLANIQALQDQAAGRGPSLAAQQAQNSEQANIAGQMATMASQRGAANSALGMRQAAVQGAQAQQQAANQAVTGRIAEETAAQQQLTGAIGNQNQADIGLATSQAGLNQNVNLANMSALNSTASQNAQLAQNSNQFNANLASQNNQFNANQQNQYQMSQAQMNQQANLANLQAQLGQENMNNNMVGNMLTGQSNIYSNIGSQNAADAALVSGAQAQANQQQQQNFQWAVGEGVQIGGAAAQMMGGFMSDETLKENTANANNEMQGFIDQLNKSTQDQKTQAAQQQQQQQSSSSSSPMGGSSSGGMMSMMKGFMGNKGGSSGSSTSTPSASDDTDILSDENQKKDVEDDEYQTQSFLDALKAHSWEYKNPEHGKGRFTGVMAQELENTDIGKQAVVETPAGKAVDYGRLAGVMLASITMLNEKVKKLEKGKK